jgi:hypothetical protein
MDSLLAADQTLFRWTYDLPLPPVLMLAITHLATKGGIWVAAAVALLPLVGIAVVNRETPRRLIGLAVGATFALPVIAYAVLDPFSRMAGLIIAIWA